MRQDNRKSSTTTWRLRLELNFSEWANIGESVVKPKFFCVMRSISMIKTRFCPSPTGEIHLGNARTALFCDLLAHGHQGQLLLRIEDTDRERSQEKYTLQLMDDLNWLGITWQEGPRAGGDAGPYFQSERQDIYDSFYHKLEQKNLIYPCFCTNEQLQLQRKIQRSRGLPPRYSGTCRHLSTDEVQARLDKGQLPTWRFRANDGQTIEFVDLVKGTQRFKTDDIGDFVIKRADGTAPFLYCNAIDDALMGVTHVLRGEDHLTNTPRQLMILEALELPKPHYGHISLIMAIDGSPLSKRHGSRSIRELQTEGFLPLGVVNYLARLGHYYSQPEFLSYAELAREFKFENLGRAAARFDETQLLYWQREAVMKVDSNTLWNWMGTQVHSLVPSQQKDLFMETIRSNITFAGEALDWAKICFGDNLNLSEEAIALLKTVTPNYFSIACEAVNQHGLNASAIFEAIKEQLQLKGKALYQPLRVALTGQMHGPELGKILELLGREKVLFRLKK